MSILKNIKEVFTGKTGTGFFGGVIGSISKDILQKNLETVIGQGIKKFVENPAELLPIFGSLNQENQKRIAYLFKKAIEAGREKELSLHLAKAVITNSQGEPETDIEKMKQKLTQIAQSNKESLNTMIEGLSRGSLFHRLEYLLGEFAKLLKKIFLGTLTGSTFVIEKLDQMAEKKAKEVDDRVNKIRQEFGEKPKTNRQTIDEALLALGPKTGLGKWLFKKIK